MCLRLHACHHVHDMFLPQLSFKSCHPLSHTWCLHGLPVQVTACDQDTRQTIEAAGGSVSRVYYNSEGLRALLKVGNTGQG